MTSALGATGDCDRALLYRQSRPPYAPGVLDFVAEHADPGVLEVVADVGCGTGLSTLPFGRAAGTLIGVEPDPAMRAIAETTLSPHGARVLPGSAERTGLPDNSVSLIVAASCFEWFHPQRAAAEWRRVLCGNGWVLLMWNHRVVADPATRAWERLWAHHMGPRLGPAMEDIEGVLVPRFLGPKHHRFRRVEHHRFSEARLRQFALSSSYAPHAAQERRRRVEADRFRRHLDYAA